MNIGKGTLAVLAAGCVAAGAAGTYVATRGEPAGISVVSPDPFAPVDQSEGVVAPLQIGVSAQPEPSMPARPPAPRRQATRPAPPRVVTVQPAPEAPAPEIELPVTGPPRVEPQAPALQPLEAFGPVYDDLIVPAGSVIGLQLEVGVSSEAVRVEDRVVARTTRDVKAGDRVAIPAGTRAEGEVTFVERGGRLRERARLGVRFTSLVMADGTRVPIRTETVVREGDSPANESAAKIGGGAVGGAIIGGILGGARGAAIGGSVGAGAGTAAAMAGGRNPATLPAGAPITVRIEDPVTVTVER